MSFHGLIQLIRPEPAVSKANDNGTIKVDPGGHAEGEDCAAAKFDANAVRESLERVLELLRPALAAASHDEAMLTLILSPSEFEEPLSKHEVIVLACALYTERHGGTFAYNDVLELTDRFRGRAMNTTMVYKTILRLQERGLIESKGREVDEKTERLSQIFAINDEGRMAFRLAVLNAYRLTRSRGKVAA